MMKKYLYVLVFGMTMLFSQSSCADCDCMDKFNEVYQQELTVKREMIKKALKSAPTGTAIVYVNGNKVSAVEAQTVIVEEDLVHFDEYTVFKIVDLIVLKPLAGRTEYHFKG